MQLDFFQRRIGVVTLLLVGVTLASALVLFTGEWSRTFWLELAMLIFAELVFGAAHMHVFGRDDTILPFAAAVGPLSAGYLAFVLLMGGAALFEMRFRHFALLHLVGFVAFVIAWLVHGMGARAMVGQGVRDRAALAAKRNFHLDMVEIMQNARTVFADCGGALSHGERLADALRYAATSKAGMDAADQKVADAIAAVSAALSARDAAAFKAGLQNLDIAYRMREEHARTL